MKEKSESDGMPRKGGRGIPFFKRQPGAMLRIEKGGILEPAALV